MIELQSMRMKNVVYYKTMRFDFKPGVTAILGDNKNARTAGANNGAGKSSMFIPLHSALGYEAPLIKGRQGIKDSFTKGSEAGITWKRGKVQYDSLRHGSKFTVSRNGKDLGLRTQALALEKLRALRSLTEVQFYSTVYLDSSKSHAFQAGTSTERMNFFTELFDLHEIDNVRKWLSTLVTDARSAERELQRLRAELQSITVTDVTETQQRYESLVRKQEQLQQMLRKLATIRHLSELWATHKTLQAKINDLEAFVGRWTLKSIKGALRLHRDYEVLHAEHVAWTKQKHQLRADIKDLQGKLQTSAGLAEATSRLAVLDRLSEVERPAKPHNERPVDAEVNELHRLFNTQDLKEKHGRTLEKKGAQLKAKLRELGEALTTLETHVGNDDSAVCPLCTTELQHHHFKVLKKSLQHQQAKYERQQRKVQDLYAVLGAVLQWTAYDQQMVAYEKQWKGYSAAAHKHWRSYVRALQLYKRHLQSEPAQLSKPKGIPEASELEVLKERCTRLQALREQPPLPSGAEQQLRAYVEQHDLPFESKAIHDHAVAHEQELGTKLRSINEKIPKLRSAIDMARADAKRARALQKELAQHKAAARDLPVLSLLVNAYSKSGIKSLIIMRLAKIVERNLNRLAASTMREPMRFELIVDGANFHVIAHRRNFGRARAGDVRTLSGAERRMFILMFLRASLPLLPAAKRWDTLILDEPYANLDPPNSQLLRDVLIPKLMKVVPKLVLIVTSPSQVPTGARVVTAVKNNDVTTLNVKEPVHA